MNLPKISYHLNKIRQENVISELFETGKREILACFSSNIDYQKYSIGSTFASLEASIILQY